MNKVISVNIIGNRTGRTYSGEFTVKSMMTQKDEFNADLRRRQIIGPSPDGTGPAPALQWKAFMFGQIHARTIEAPPFWEESDGGLNIQDGNVVTEVYEAVLKVEEEVEAAIKAESEKALEKLTKKASKATETEE